MDPGGCDPERMVAPRRVVLVCAALAAALTAGCGQGTDDAARAFPAAGVKGAAAGGVRLVGVGRFDQPLYLTSPPGDTSRLFVVEQPGRIRIVRGGRVRRAPFLDIRSLVTSGGEQGLLSVAFPPDYATSGRFYVYYTDKQAKQRIVEYHRAGADRADPSSARLVLRMDDPEPNHNGGLLRFGPDGLLYVGTGDGGGGNDQHGARGNAQDLGSLLGKLLRIDPRARGTAAYRIPDGNPFVGRAGARGEIYAYGLRNPWRFAFDRETGDLSIGDVGQDAVEEIDFVRRGAGRGANFGWRALEGNRVSVAAERPDGAIPPVITKRHADGWCSITGGVVVRDPALPALRGRYLYGDFCQGRIRAARLRAGQASGDHALRLRKVDALSSFGEDARGRVYVISTSGPVYRLAAG
jgi:glucose/arabinose dehydrogenase